MDLRGRQASFGLLSFLLAVTVAACSPALSGEGSTPSSEPPRGGHGAAPGVGSPSPTELAIKVTMSGYGALIIETSPGATCRAKAELPSGNTVLASDFLTDQKVDSAGRATWRYSTQIAGAGAGYGRYFIDCARDGRSVDATAEFAVR